MGFGGSGGGKTVRSDINVTPLVDVVLVLLIIFIVTMPILMRQITIEVPRKLDEDVQAEMLPDRQLVVELDKDGRLLLDEKEISRTDLATDLRDKLERKRDKVVFVAFADSTRYGDAVSIIDTCKGVLKDLTGDPDKGTIALRMKEEGQAGGGPGVNVTPSPTP